MLPTLEISNFWRQAQTGEGDMGTNIVWMEPKLWSVDGVEKKGNH